MPFSLPEDGKRVSFPIGFHQLSEHRMMDKTPRVQQFCKRGRLRKITRRYLSVAALSFRFSVIKYLFLIQKKIRISTDCSLEGDQ
jgi:hypothetical protein